MRKLVVGCALAGLIVLSPKSEKSKQVPCGALRIRAVKHHHSVQIGLASWYGMERQGIPTASGEIFDCEKFTAAHRLLPFGTTVRVTNLRNYESTTLKINDRGPGVPERVIDLSWAAANQLGFVDDGLTRVKIDVLSYPVACAHQVPDVRSPKLN